MIRLRPIFDLSCLDDPPEVEEVWRRIEAQEAADAEEERRWFDWVADGEPPTQEEINAWDAWLETPEGVAAREEYEKKGDF